MTKEQILELISKYVTSTAAEMIAAEFEKKEKEAADLAKFSIWYYNDSLYYKTITW